MEDEDEVENGITDASEQNHHDDEIFASVAPFRRPSLDHSPKSDNRDPSTKTQRMRRTASKKPRSRIMKIILNTKHNRPRPTARANRLMTVVIYSCGRVAQQKPRRCKACVRGKQGPIGPFPECVSDPNYNSNHSFLRHALTRSSVSMPCARMKTLVSCVVRLLKSQSKVRLPCAMHFMPVTDLNRQALGYNIHIWLRHHP